MRHNEAMSQLSEPDPGDPNPTCSAELIDPNRSLSADVFWVAYTCPACKVCIATVGGGIHWWNHITEPSPSRAERIAALT